MKGKPFRDQDNRALHERRMKERTRIVVTQKNIEYILLKPYHLANTPIYYLIHFLYKRLTCGYKGSYLLAVYA